MTSAGLVLLDTCGDPADLVVAFLNTLRRRRGHRRAGVDAGVGRLAAAAGPARVLRRPRSGRPGAGAPAAPRPACPRRGATCAEVRSVGIQVARDRGRRGGAERLLSGRARRGGRRQGRHRAPARPGQDLSGRRLPVGLLRHLPQPVAPVVLDGGLRQPCQGSLAPGGARPPPRPSPHRPHVVATASSAGGPRRRVASAPRAAQVPARDGAWLRGPRRGRKTAPRAGRGTDGIRTGVPPRPQRPDGACSATVGVPLGTQGFGHRAPFPA